MRSQEQVHKAAVPDAPRAAWSPAEWAAAFGFTVWWFHQLKGELAPKSIMIRGRRLVTEPPTEYARRIAAAQELR